MKLTCWNSFQCREAFNHMKWSCRRKLRSRNCEYELLTFLLGFEVTTGKLCIFHLKTSTLMFLASLENIRAEVLN